LALVFSISRSHEVIEQDTILQVQVDVADMVMQAQGMDSTDGKVMLSIDSDGDALDDSDALDQREMDPDDLPAQVADPVAEPLTIVPDAPDPPQAPCGNEVDPPPSCRSPKGNFKVCAMYGDPHISATFRGRTFSEDDRGDDLAHLRPAQFITSHYGHGLFDIFKSKDNSMHAQGFFCPLKDGNTLGNSLNMAVVKIGNDRILWKRPLETFNKDPPLGFQQGPDYYMWMYINGYRTHWEDVKPPGYTNSFMWAHQLHLAEKHWEWQDTDQHNFCVGTNDRQLTIKMATPPSKIWIPSIVLELAEDQVAHDGKSICSLGNSSGRGDVDPVSWSESLFSMEELLEMCKGCGLMPTVEEGELQEFSGCNPSGATPEFDAKKFCDEMKSDADEPDADLSKCDNFDDHPAWKEACVVEICSVGAVGFDETLDYEAIADPLQGDELVGRYSVKHWVKNMPQEYEIVIACDDSVTRMTDSPTWSEVFGKLTHSYVAYELLQKCPYNPELRNATKRITNSEVGLFACLAEDPDASKFTLAGMFYKVSNTGASVPTKRNVEYTMEEKYHCACTQHCSSCSDASHCVTCSYGYELVDREEGPQCEKPSIVKQLSGPPQT